MDCLTFLLVLFSISWIFTFSIISSSRARKSSRLPPGPFPFPILGNILALGSKPHHSLANLSRKYGPVMSLKLGALTTIVISSPEAAKSVFQTHDLSFSSRTIPTAASSLDHDKYSMVWLPVDAQWRKLRKLCKEQMFSVSRLDSSQGLRVQKLEKLCDYVNKCCETGRVVGIGEAAFTTSLNLMSATLFSKEFAQFDTGSSQELKEMAWGVMKCLGAPNLADYFPVLKPFDIQGILRENEVYFGRFFAIFDEIIDERLRSESRGAKNDLVEALIKINQRDEAELSRNDIKNLLLDLFVAGIDTTSGTVEWAMTELLRNPDKMSRVRQEIIDIVGTNRQVQESDISKLPYLQAVVKETFRLHPTVPFLVPHKAETDVDINGYIVPKNAQILVNVWASGRDSNVWPNAESFIPERFLDSQIDFRGRDFELIPFGAGRRICPGLPLASRMVHLIIATLIYNFGWKLEEGTIPEEIDMNEKFGLTLQKAVPLMAIPIKL